MSKRTAANNKQMSISGGIFPIFTLYTLHPRKLGIRTSPSLVNVVVEWVFFLLHSRWWNSLLLWQTIFLLLQTLLFPQIGLRHFSICWCGAFKIFLFFVESVLYIILVLFVVSCIKVWLFNSTVRLHFCKILLSPFKVIGSIKISSLIVRITDTKPLPSDLQFMLSLLAEITVELACVMTDEIFSFCFSVLLLLFSIFYLLVLWLWRWCSHVLILYCLHFVWILWCFHCQVKARIDCHNCRWNSQNFQCKKTSFFVFVK